MFGAEYANQAAPSIPRRLQPFEGLLVDNFAGGGGASTGIEAATGRKVDVAINHDAEAIAMHMANHPLTRHFCQSIYSIDPLEATGGQPVLGAWFSPDCKHFSKAKGGKPVDKNIRDLASVVPHWIKRLGPDRKPRIIWLENVEEFRTWGPLGDDGKPCPKRKGETFEAWVRQLRRAGYKVEWRELRACDYGAPTSRKRLIVVARCDGLPIVWPTPTHGKPGSPEVLSGKRLPWRTAAECIDWSIPAPSIFERKRPLKEATLRRIAHGVMRYVVNAAEPFIVGTAFTNTRASRVFGLDETIRTATSQPEYGVVDAAIVPITHSGDPARVHSPREPTRTITTANGGELTLATATLAPHITKFRSGSIGSPASEPVPTVTANGEPKRPAGATPLGLVGATLVQTSYGERQGQEPRVPHLEKPLGTVVAGGGKHAAVTAFLSHFYSSNTNGGRGDPKQPANAVTAEGQHHAVVCAHIEQANTGMVGHPPEKPLSTIVGKGCTQRIVETTLVEADALPPQMMERAVNVAAFLIKYYGAAAHGQSLDQPMHSATAKARFAVVTVVIDAVTYIIVDIGMRMLTRRELANAQGFPHDYILDPIGPNGRPLSISSSIRMIGNSVCPDLAEAIVRSTLGIVDEEREAA